jgi:plasmid stabilization system protein ParE
VELAPRAVNDLREIRSYIAETLDAPAAAERTVRHLIDAIGKLEKFPFRNRVLAQLPDGRELRRVCEDNYIALYIVVDNKVSILTVVYQLRRKTPIFRYGDIRRFGVS